MSRHLADAARAGRFLAMLVMASALPSPPCVSANTSIPLNYSAPQMLAPVAIDGKLDEWRGVEPILLAGEARWKPARPGEAYGGPSDSAARFYLAWDKSNLYIAVEAYDNDLSPPESAEKMLDGDCIIVAVDARDDASQGYREDDSEFGFAYTAAGPVTWRWFPSDRAGALYSAKVAVVREVKPGALAAGMPPLKLTYEIAVPWFELADTRHDVGGVSGFNLAINDVDEGRRHGWLQWTPGIMGVKDPSRFGNIHLAGPLSAAPPQPPEETPAPSTPSSPAPASRGVSFDRRSFMVKDRAVLLYSGAFHYFRCPKGEWSDRLAKMKAAGLNCLSTYVPWNWHEQREGQADLADLDEFLSLAETAGFYVIAQPGPYIGADWTEGGFPAWLSVKGVRYRSAEPAFLEQCRHWFSQVMPVIARHQVGTGGSVILVQLESNLGGDGADNRELLRALHEMARKLGVEVPLITSGTPAARDNSDPVMADIIDGVALGADWDATTAAQALLELSAQEANAPTLVTDLPTDSAAAESSLAPSARAANGSDRISGLTCVALECGGDLINYSMGCGGTNFGYWAAEGTPTTYDRGAPISEHGGLTPKYYAVKGVGDFLSSFGSILARSWRLPHGSAFADQAGISVVERISGESAFLFIRDQTETTGTTGDARHIRVTYTDPMDGRQVTIPAAGHIALPRRGVRMLVCGVPLAHGRLEYCTSGVTALELAGDRQVLTLRGDPGEAGELRLRLDAPSALGGDAVGTAWDPARRTLDVSYRFRDIEQHAVLDSLELVIAPAKRAERSWKVATGADSIRIISDAYFLRDAAASDSGVAMTFDLRPGDASFTTVVPKAPSKLTVDGRDAPFTYDSVTRVLTFSIRTPAVPERPPRRGGVFGRIKDIITYSGPPLRQSFNRARAAMEPLIAELIEQPVELKPLQELQVFDAGYAKYHAAFDPAGRTMLSIDAYAADPKVVYVNQRMMPALSQAAVHAETDVSQFLHAGPNQVDVIYHDLGWPAEGARIAEPKGLREARLSAARPATTPPGSKAASIAGWRMQPRLSGEAAGFHLPQYNDGAWNVLRFGDWKRESPALRDFEGIMWYRIAFEAPQRPGWQIPWKLRLDAAEQTMIYLNGRLLGKHFAQGPQSEFYLPREWLRPEGKNALAVAVRSGERGGGLKAVAIEPYDDSVVRPTRVVISY